METTPANQGATHGLACPNCQGRLHIPEGMRVIRCPFCDLRSLVRGDRGLLRYQVPREIDRQQAEARLRGFLRGIDRAPGLSRRAELTDLFVVYLPYWSEWAEVAAWLFGKRKTGSGKNRRLEPREVRLVGTRMWNQAACDVQEFGVDDVSLGGRRLEAFDPEDLHADGMVFEPVSPASAAWIEAGEAIEADVRDEANLEVLGSAHIHRLGGRRAIVYYPLWVARYSFRERSFQVVIDGARGDVLYGKAPGNTWFRAGALVVGFALAAMLLVDGTALALQVVAASEDSDSAGLLCIPLVLGTTIMVAAYRRFRFGEMLERRVSFRRKRKPPSLLGETLKVWTSLSDQMTKSVRR